MNKFESFLLPVVLGLISGIGHGISSHYQELPFSLTEQVVQSACGDCGTLQSEQTFFE